MKLLKIIIVALSLLLISGCSEDRKYHSFIPGDGIKTALELCDSRSGLKSVGLENTGSKSCGYKCWSPVYTVVATCSDDVTLRKLYGEIK